MKFYPSIGDRHKTTIDFIKKTLPEGINILDLGTQNVFTDLLRNKGFTIFNTTGEDLDLFPESIKKFNVEAVIALEIIEHLVSPFALLKNLPADKLVATVPLRLWFSKAYRNDNDPWDNHYHEFEDWQFDWLLEKAGWQIIERQKWTSPSGEIGIRPLLRKFTPRYYAVYAVRNH